MNHVSHSYSTSPYLVQEYETGWYVEKPDPAMPAESCAFIEIAGPFESQSDAYAMKRVLDQADAKGREFK